MVMVMSLGEILKHPDEVYYLLKLKMAVRRAEKEIFTSPDRRHQEPHWVFCYTMLQKSIRSHIIFDLILPPSHTHLRDAVCLFYVIHRALDTIEDDTSIPAETKVPMLIDFHSHLHDLDWHFSCGRDNDKVLMDEFHHVTTAFLELSEGFVNLLSLFFYRMNMVAFLAKPNHTCRYQEAIEDTMKRLGAGMAKYIHNEIETIDDYDEYCHEAGGVYGIGISKIFHIARKEDVAPQELLKQMVIIYQKKDIIEDFLEDIDEKPKPRKFWPREIWRRYVDKIEDLTYKENSEKAVQCLNEMVTDALKHMEYCLNNVSSLKDEAALQLAAILLVVAFGTLALCYNNIEVFKSKVKLRPGLIAKIVDRTKTLPDLYNAFFEFSSIMKSKVKMHDPNAMKTLSRLNQIQEICTNSGLIDNRKHYIVKSEQRYNSSLINVALFVLPLITIKYLSSKQLKN